MIATLAAAPGAFAQGADVVTGLRADPLYVEPGAEEVDRREVEAAIAAAADLDLDVRVAVLAAGDGEALANGLLADLPGTTVVVFTPVSYGVASGEVSQGRLTDALADAADELSGPDAAAGLAALVDALDAGSGVSRGLLVAAAVALLLVVAVAGRAWDSRARARRQAAGRDRRRRELGERVMRIGERIVDLSDRVELADSPDASRSYAEATSIFDGADRRLAVAASMHDLDAIETDLARAEALLDRAGAPPPHS